MSLINTNNGSNLNVREYVPNPSNNPFEGGVRFGQKTAEQLINDIANGYDVRFQDANTPSSEMPGWHCMTKAEPGDLNGVYSFMQNLDISEGKVTGEGEYIYIRKPVVNADNAARLESRDTQGLNTDYTLDDLLRLNPVHQKRANNTIAPLNFPASPVSLETLSDFTLQETREADVQTESVKASGINRYGGLVASTLATILGAVLVIVAKTHGHEDAEIQGAEDMTPTEPDYNAISTDAAEQAEQAFYDKWHDPEVWGPGMIDSDGRNIETGERNPYYTVERDDNGEYSFTSDLTPEGQRTLGEVREQASETAVSQARSDYEKALEEAAAHNGTLPEAQSINDSGDKDHKAMLGIGATLIGIGGLATTLIAGNKLTNHSHAKQQAQGLPVEHGPVKNFVEQNLFRVRA